MADQRRYGRFGYTPEQLDRALASGEQVPEDMSWYDRLGRNIAAGLPNALLQIGQLPEVAKNVYNATDASIRWRQEHPEEGFASNSPWMMEYAKSAFGGDEGLRELGEYINRETDAYLAELPEADRNNPETRKSAEAAVIGSKGYHDLLMSKTGTLNQASEAAQNAVNESLGLPPVYQQTIVDEAEQLIPSAFVPLKWFGLGGRSVEKLATSGAQKLAVRAAESVLPGSHSLAGGVGNFAVQEAITQGMRYAGNQPSVFTGDALINESLQRSTAPAAAPAPEAANSQSPFSITAAAAESPTDWQLPFQYGGTPSTDQSPLFTQPPTAPDSDPSGGGDGWSMAKIAAGVGAAGLIAATMRGRLPTGLTQKVIQDVDSPASRRRMDPTATDNIQLQPSLTPRQKRRTTLEKTHPIEAVTRNALEADNDPQLQQKINRITRETGAASRLEINNALQRTQLTGEVPLLNRKTVPTMQLRRLRDTDMTPDEQDLFQKRVVYGSRMDDYKLETDSINDKINDMYIALRRITNPTQRQLRLGEIRTLEAQVRARNDPLAPFDGNISVAEVNRIIGQANANPKIQRLIQGMRQVRDDFNEAGVNSGMFTRDYVDRMNRERPNFMPLAVDPYKGKTFTERVKAVRGRGEVGESGGQWQELMYGAKRGPARTNRMTKDAPIAQLDDVLNSLDTSIYEFHRQLRINRAAQTFTETLADTRSWGKTVQRAAPPLSIQDFERAHPNSKIGRIINEPNVYVYNANGQMYVMRAADSEVARALRHNPSSTLAWADQTRRVFQSTYTGNVLAPWFAWRAAENELGVVRVTLDRKYSKGMIDQLLKSVFPDTTLSRAFDFAPDPSLRLQQLGAIMSQVSGYGMQRLSELLGNRFMSQSALIKNMGPGQANTMAQAGIRTANDIRNKYQFMKHHGILSHQQVIEANENVFRDFTAVQKMLSMTPKFISVPAREAFNAYVNIADAVRNSVKYAVASQNLDNLLRKYNGNIPDKVLRQYVHDMKYMSGDMTKAIGSPTLASAASAVPYGQNIINSTLYLYDSVAANKAQGITRIATNMVLPKVMWTVLLTKWMQNDDGTNDFVEHYWDRMPTWQRMSTVPMLSPFYLYDIMTGEYRKPLTTDIIFMPQAPEAIPFAETFMSMAQAAGLFGVHAKDTQTWHDVVSAVGSLMNVNVPIIDSLNWLTGEKEDLPANLGGESDTSRSIRDLVGTLFGGSVDVVGQAFLAATDSLYRGAGVQDALWQGFSYAAETTKQRFPETPVSPLFGGQRRNYTKTQVRDRNVSKFEAIEDVSRTMSDMKKDIGNEGLTMPFTTDPYAQAMMKELHSTANAGAMKALRKQRSDLYGQIKRLDENRGKVAAHDYTRLTEQLKIAIQDVDRQEEETFERMEMRLRGNFGKLGVVDTESAIDYIKGTMQR